MAKINFYELVESQVSSATGLPAGSYICTTDTKNIYMVPSTGSTPVRMGTDLVITTESARNALLSPISNRFYYCTDTKRLWIYNGSWSCLNEVSDSLCIMATLTSSGSVTVEAPNIKPTSIANFIPDYSIEDLVSNVSVTCYDGYAVITGTCSYDIFGMLMVYAV